MTARSIFDMGRGLARGDRWMELTALTIAPTAGGLELPSGLWARMVEQALVEVLCRRFELPVIEVLPDLPNVGLDALHSGDPAWRGERPEDPLPPPGGARLPLLDVWPIFDGIYWTGVPTAPRPDLRQHEGTPLPDDTVDTLCDLARAGDETAFKELARMVGVAEADLEPMWTGTVARVGKRPEA